MRRLQLKDNKETLYARISKENKLFIEHLSYTLRISEAMIVNEILTKQRMKFEKKNKGDQI